MPISWNEIRHRSAAFCLEWKDETKERAEAQSFWNDFFLVFGINRRRVASFEAPVKKLDNNYGFIDLFWKGVLLVEHKSKGEDLNKAYSQALEYFANLKDHELPKYVLVSDFDRFKLYNLDDREENEFGLSELTDNLNLLGFIAGYTQKKNRDQIPVNISAAEKMGKLHDDLLDSGFRGHELEIFLMRFLFCMFADDTGMFDKSIFADYIRENTSEDGSDLGGRLAAIFQTLDTSVNERQRNIDILLGEFPYVNGSLFHENLRIAHFDSRLRETLLECCGFNWSKISPAIFGSMFQSVMSPKERRKLGAHYTSESNILRLIEPLFLNELKSDFDNIKNVKHQKLDQLNQFHLKISNLKFFDPACGCGNFLAVTYKELRKLEIDILFEIQKNRNFRGDLVSVVNVGQFYGIEKEEFPSRIATVALWLIDHQMNLELSKKIGIKRESLPLSQSLNILNDNALHVEWNVFAPVEEIDYILGNPPFKGENYQTAQEKLDIRRIFKGVKSYGVLDYVSAWYLLASKYIQNTRIKVAFVSTNSITMGEQVGILWSVLFHSYNIKIHFAHRTFKWTSEAKKKAAVHVVIVGFSAHNCNKKFIYEYPDIAGEPQKTEVSNINPYLTDNADTLVLRRKKPICLVPEIRKGNQPTDGGHLILSDKEKTDLLLVEPRANLYIKRFMGAREFLYDKKRWCLWLVGASGKKVRELPEVMKRVEKVQKFREKSTAEDTRKNAATPSLFREQNNPSSYLVIPSTTSENRKYIPIGFLGSDVIPSNLLLIMPDADLWHFGVISSYMHMVWVKYTCGRLESRYRYSKDIVYNNFPWPQTANSAKIMATKKAAQIVLDERAKQIENNLADMYDPLAMPQNLVKAHASLDKTVDKCYQNKPFLNDIDRLKVLLDLHEKYKMESSK